MHPDDPRTSNVIGSSSTDAQPVPLAPTFSLTPSDATTALDEQKQEQPKYPGSPPPPPIQTPDNDKKASQNVAVRFLLAVRDVLLSSYVNILLVFVPVGMAAHTAKLPSGVVFGMNAVAIMPLARLLSYATESLANGFGDAVGALMSVTFGNAVELIIFIIALSKNHIRIVQASLVGSILVNLLLVLGMSFLLGGLRFREQVYNSTVTQMSACLLALSVTSLLLPTAFHLSFSSEKTADYRVLQVSRGTSVIVLMVYFLYLIFQLKSHSYIYEATPQEIIERETVPGPAAHYFESSTSGSESSDSESDGSNGASRRRRRRIARRRKNRGPLSRKYTGETQSSSATVIATPTMSSTLGGNSMTDDDELLSMGHGTDDEKGVTVPSDRRRNRNSRHAPRRSQQHTESERSRNLDGRSRPLSTGHRVDAMSPRPITHSDLEAQQEPAHRDPLFFLPRRTSTRTSRPTTANRSNNNKDNPNPNHPSRTTAILLLLVCTALVAIHAEFMVSSIASLVATDRGLSEAFIGLILLPIVGNAAEHVTAVGMALRNKLDLAIGVAVGSSVQMALFVTPAVVVLGWGWGKEMGLFFTLFETVCVFVSAFIVNFLVLDGRSNYLEGALLCSAYVIVAVAAFFYPDGRAASELGGGP
ncbi:Sodium/calcium exchanger protein-domain-containing protein [Dichotomopilus funicola]|uniref:Sodium/calcium exchanger protein-domain-containing protein n=1 Tax=Dichotomopilus funicola TaxID=1934379 RepID=A0AAN6V6A5_9PEZI|nr:Sodium/calcium exchanger protein-domain-containing protein [Dichotomopilus funicola]